MQLSPEGVIVRMDLGLASQNWQSRCALMPPRLTHFFCSDPTMYMHTRKLHALLACGLFLLAAGVYTKLSGQPIELWRVAFWSMVGIASYIALSGAFGFDPHRTRIARFASPLMQYVDRWELRLGQATLSMLGCVALAAGLLDHTNFVTAVVSGTLSAWTYFALRLYAGGYGRVNLAQR
jgi:hypothetical protein